jgi:uncharacterized membrane protein
MKASKSSPKEIFIPILTLPEGFVTGMAAKMFTVAGPVLTYGISASAIYGLILWLLGAA